MLKAKKDDKKDVKPDYSLIPKALMDQLAFVMMAGETKYGRYNYCRGHKANQLTAAATRHIKQIESGEDIDRDTTNHLKERFGDNAPEVFHWACVAASALMAIHQMELGTHVDDRFKPEQKEEAPRRVIPRYTDE